MIAVYYRGSWRSQLNFARLRGNNCGCPQAALIISLLMSASRVPWAGQQGTESTKSIVPSRRRWWHGRGTQQPRYPPGIISAVQPGYSAWLSARSWSSELKEESVGGYSCSFSGTTDGRACDIPTDTLKTDWKRMKKTGRGCYSSIALQRSGYTKCCSERRTRASVGIAAECRRCFIINLHSHRINNTNISF